MSVGVFLGIGAAWTDADEVDQVRQRVTAALAAADLPPYIETTSFEEAAAQHTALHPQARCAIDTISTTSFQKLSRIVMRARGPQAGPFADFATHVERVFVPGDFTQRLDAGKLPGRTLWSTGALRTALRYAALTLGLPLSNNEVPEKVIKLVNAKKKLGKNDLASDEPDEHGFNMLDDYRIGWLTVWEFARLAHEHKLALVFA